MVSKIKLRFYLKPVNREYPYSSVGMRAAAIIAIWFPTERFSAGLKLRLCSVRVLPLGQGTARLTFPVCRFQNDNDVEMAVVIRVSQKNTFSKK